MALNTTSPSKTLLFLLCLTILLFGAQYSKPELSAPFVHKAHYDEKELQPVQSPNREGVKSWRGEGSRRWLIGSTAPTCTYECRGCRFKCTAEQVPVDANDPINSAYRYRCVCHR